METKYRDLPFDLKALDGAGSFAGYASVFGVVDGCNDVVARGAFGPTLARNRAGRGVKMLWAHQSDEPIGKWDEIVEDGHGLRVKGRLLLDVRRAAEVHALLKAGAIDGLSIGYSAVEAATDPDSGLRTLIEIDLWEISLVTFQACPGAAVSAIKGAKPRTAREFERFLRDTGRFSHQDAKAIASGGFNALSGRDAEERLVDEMVARLERAAMALTH